MNLLLDTQSFLWFESGDSRLSETAKKNISDSSNTKFLSIASYWEIAIKNSIDKLELHVSFDELLSLPGYTIIHISPEHLKMLRSLPYHHRDPFDRMIIAQSLCENISAVSSDLQFDLYGVKRIW